jgi:hypothetical protein
MEETVWLYFSVVAVIFVLGIIAGLIVSQKDEGKLQTFSAALDTLQSQCNYVCSLGSGTNLPIEVILPAGLYLYTNGPKICGTIDDENRCVMCDCDLEQYHLELNTSFAEKALQDHTYSCSFRRTKDGASMECQG